MSFPDPLLQIHRGWRGTGARTSNFLEVPISVKNLRVGNVHRVTPQLMLFSTENGCVTKKKNDFSPKRSLSEAAGLSWAAQGLLPKQSGQDCAGQGLSEGLGSSGAGGHVPVPGCWVTNFNKNCCFGTLDNWLNSWMSFAVFLDKIWKFCFKWSLLWESRNRRKFWFFPLQFSRNIGPPAFTYAFLYFELMSFCWRSWLLRK